jgi:hypothetical protein
LLSLPPVLRGKGVCVCVVRKAVQSGVVSFRRLFSKSFHDSST